MSLLRSPLIHFLALGVLLFAAQSAWTTRLGSESASRPTIEISPERLATLETEFIAQAGHQPTRADRARLLQQEIDDEILLAEARALGLHERDGGVQTRLIQKMLFLDGEARLEDAPALLERARALELDRGDIVVRRILIQKMKLLGSALRQDERPNVAAIEARYAEQRDVLREPDRADLVHVFFSSDERGESARPQALDVRQKILGASIDPEKAIAFGDPFPLGHRLGQRAERDLVRSFGAGFGPAVRAIPTGTWSEPIESAYGVHLVFVASRTPGRIPPLIDVEDQIRRTLEHERQQAKFAAFQQSLRARYDVAMPESRAPESPEEIE